MIATENPVRRVWAALAMMVAVGSAYLGTSASPAWAADESKSAGTVPVYFGTYTNTKGQSKGIYRSELDLATGELSPPVLAGETVNPSFLAISPDERFLYAVSEVSDATDKKGKKSGAVAAFSIDPESKDLALLNKQLSMGQGPCHVSIDRAGQNVLVANYGSGSVAALKVADDGSLLPSESYHQHQGSSIDKPRQSGPHAHSINLDASNRYAFVADLGLDKVLIYRFDPSAGILDDEGTFASVKPGAGPRHFAFHPSGRFAYVINELDSTVTAFRYDGQHGTLSPFQSVRTLPDDFDGQNTTAEVVVHPNGRFLYGSNRGDDSIAIFEINPATGELRPEGHQSTKGQTPRNFAIDPTGQFLLAANQGSDNIVVFKIDPSTGQLTPTGSEITVAAPVCVRFLRPTE